MMKNTLFSILIAQYNNGKFLMEAIDSVRAQTYTNWEIIIVDDCSTDNSNEIYALLENDSRIKVYHNEENKGCGYTKHRCAELATGEICGFLDPDDTLTSDALEVMVREHSKNDTLALVGSTYWACDENLTPLWQKQVHIIEKGESYLSTFPSPIHFAAYKNIYYKETGGIDKYLKRAVDFDLYARLEDVGKVHFIADTLYNYRQHTNQITTSGDFKSLYWLIYALSQACKRRGIDAEEIANKYIATALDWYIQNYRRETHVIHGVSIVTKLKNKCKKILKRK